MTDPMELVRRLDELHTILCAQKKHAGIKNGDGNSSDWEPSDRVCNLPKEAAACIREMVEQRAGLYDAVSLGFYDGFRDAITRDPWEDCYDYAAAKGADYAKSVMARIIAKQAADPTRRLNPLPPAPGAEA